MDEPSSSTSTAVTIPDAVEVADGDEPPRSPSHHSPCHPVWADVPDLDWNDWHWQSQHAVRHPRQLLDLLPFTPTERQAIESLQAQYKLAIPLTTFR